MFKNSKKSITLALLLTLGANSCSYGVNFGFLWGEQNIFRKAKNGLVRAKNYIGEKLTWAKDKIVEHATVQNVSFSIFALFALYRLRGVIKFGKTYKQPSKAVKNCVTKIAQRLKIKNPEKIKIKIDDEKYSDRTSIFGSVVLSKETASRIHSNESKFVIGHELSHYKHKDCLVGVLLSQLLNLLLQKWKRKIIGARNIPLFRKDHRNISVKRRLLSLGFSVVMDCFALPFVFSHTFGKYCETRADIESSSLGKNFADGAIECWKKYCPMWGKISFLKRLRFSFLDPHFPPGIRLGYSKWYKKWKYGK